MSRLVTRQRLFFTLSALATISGTFLNPGIGIAKIGVSWQEPTFVQNL